MTRFLRFFGSILIVIGALVTLTWFISPLRQLWPHLLKAFHSLPVAVQAGSAIAVIGFLILFSSIVFERLEDRKKENNLLDDI